ncbi:hypothetical protein DU295_16465 [Escherichia coli]|nr:hypothetical protein DU295_16465 [Escherichia coli]
MHAGCGEVVKEKKSAASFDITAIFLLVMQVVVGGTQSFALDCKALCSSIVVKVDHSTFSSIQSAHHCIISLRLT